MAAQRTGFTEVADDVFGTLFTVTTILPGFFTSIAFKWYGQAV